MRDFSPVQLRRAAAIMGKIEKLRSELEKLEKLFQSSASSKSLKRKLSVPASAKIQAIQKSKFRAKISTQKKVAYASASAKKIKARPVPVPPPK